MLVSKFRPFAFRKFVQRILGLGRLKLFFAEQPASRVTVKPEPIQEPVLAKGDDNHFPKHGMVRAIMVNDQDSLINLEQRYSRPSGIWSRSAPDGTNRYWCRRII
jgi:hypothetical protein